MLLSCAISAAPTESGPAACGSEFGGWADGGNYPTAPPAPAMGSLTGHDRTCVSGLSAVPRTVHAVVPSCQESKKTPRTEQAMQWRMANSGNLAAQLRNGRGGEIPINEIQKWSGRSAPGVLRSAYQALISGNRQPPADLPDGHRVAADGAASAEERRVGQWLQSVKHET